MEQNINTYKGLKGLDVFDHFSSNVLQAAGMSRDTIADVRDELDEVHRVFSPQSRTIDRRGYSEAVWEMVGDDALNVLVGESLSTLGWRNGTTLPFRRDLYQNVSTVLNKSIIAHKAAEIIPYVNNEEMRKNQELFGENYIFDNFLPINGQIHKAATPEQRDRILGSLTRVRWNGMYDRDDPHPGAQLYDTGAYEQSFIDHKISLALDDIRQRDGSLKLKDMMNNSYRLWPEIFSTENVRLLRRVNDEPEDDEEHKEYIDRSEERAREAEIKRKQADLERSNAARQHEQELLASAIALARNIVRQRERLRVLYIIPPKPTK